MNLGSGNTNLLGLPSGPALYNEPQYNCQRSSLPEITIDTWPSAVQTQAISQRLELCKATMDVINWQAIEAGCPNLEDYGLTTSLGYRYNLQTPLFSDYMEKQRTIYLPPNSSLGYTATGPLNAPIGTIISKTFVNPNSQQIVETRLLIHRQSGWVGLPYLWSNGVAKLHVGGALVPQSINLEGKRTDWDYQVPNNLPQRARAYLDINCSHCHNPAGLAHTSGLALKAELPMSTKTGVCKPPVAAGRGAGDLSYAIVPGEAQPSILHLRMSSLDPAIKIPELSKGLVHQQGLALIKQWINQMPGTCEQL